MRLLAFVDVHGNKKAINGLIELSKKENPDALVCSGDISNFSSDLEEIIRSFKSAGKPLLIIPGNHEDENELNQLCKNFDFCIDIHKNVYKIGNYLFIGFGGGGFSFEDYEFEAFIRKIKNKISKEDKIILVTHAPIYGTKVDIIPGLGHRGCKSYRKFVEVFKPVVVICGHLHETEKISDKIGKTLIINPGKYGKIIEF